MRLLKTKSDWESFIKANDFTPDLIKEPNHFPCYAYEYLDSMEFQWVSPAYLYANEIKNMLKNLK